MNYLFFSLYYFILSILSVISYITAPEKSLSILLHSLLEISLETTLLLLIGGWLKESFNRLYRFVFPVVVFFLFFLHLIHFLLIQLMDIPFTYAFQTIFGNGITGFFITLRALNFPLQLNILLFFAILSFPVIGYAIFHLAARVQILEKIIPNLSRKILRRLAISFFTFILIFEISLVTFCPSTALFSNKKKLPYCNTFIAPTSRMIVFKHAHFPMKDEKKLSLASEKEDFSTPYKPNIYLIITESLRKDFIDSETAPNLSRFSSDEISFSHSVSNANASQISWFSIFQSQYPFFWSEQSKQWKEGSLPLRMFKKMGYKIHLLSSAELTYHNMDKALFGPHHELIDDEQDYSQENISPCYRDQKVVYGLRQRIKRDENEGHLYLIFLDSTHSEYFWPEDFETKFTPILSSLPYIELSVTKKNLPLIINRYRNAVHYVDHLFGKVENSLKSVGKWDDSLIIFTGDHGEEFFEEGALFHATHINSYQTSVPLYYKIPERVASKQKPATITSHIDIFPTVLHLLTQKEDWSDYFDGESVFNKRKRRFVMGVMQNGHHTPLEFFVMDKKHFTKAKLHPRNNLFTSKKLKIELKDKSKNKKIVKNLSRAFGEGRPVY